MISLKSGLIWRSSRCPRRLEIMAQVVPPNLTLLSCVSGGSRRSNSPAEKHISHKTSGNAETALEALHASAFLCLSEHLLCTWQTKARTWVADIWLYFLSSPCGRRELCGPQEKQNIKAMDREYETGVFFLLTRTHMPLNLILALMGNLYLNSIKNSSPCRSHYWKKFLPQIPPLKGNLALKNQQKASAGQLEKDTGHRGPRRNQGILCLYLDVLWWTSHLAASLQFTMKFSSWEFKYVLKQGAKSLQDPLMQWQK